MLSDLLLSASGSSNSPNIIRPSTDLAATGSDIYINQDHSKAYDADINSYNQIGIGDPGSSFTKIFRFATPVFIKKLKVKIRIGYKSGSIGKIGYKKSTGSSVINLMTYNAQATESSIQFFEWDINAMLSDVVFYMAHGPNLGSCNVNIYDIVGEI